MGQGRDAARRSWAQSELLAVVGGEGERLSSS